MELIKTNKTSLSKLISWSSSRYNDLTKRQVIEDIIFRVEKGEDCKVEYRSGVYSEGAHLGRFPSKWTGGNYTLEIYNGRATLSNAVSDVISTNPTMVELEKPYRRLYYVPAKTIYHRIEKYGVPVGEFTVIDQDIRAFQVMFDEKVRSLDKRDCIVLAVDEDVLPATGFDWDLCSLEK